MRAGIVIAAIAFATLPTQAGDWQSQTRKSELTEKESQIWHLTSENKVANSIGISTDAFLLVACREGEETIVMFDLQNYMGLFDDVLVRFKIDSGKIESRYANVSKDGQAFGWWRGTGISFLRRVQAGKRLVVAAEPYSKSIQEAVFDIDGIDAVIRDISQRCKWPDP